jgi:large subunit ribosomal protein L10
MTREEKSKVIEALTTELAENSNLYLTDISGLNAGTTSALRRACFKANIKLAVVKNTLLEKAMEASDKDFGDLPSILKGAFIEQAVYIGDDQLDMLVDIKSKEELIGDIIGLLQSPAKNVVSALQSSGGKLSGILKTLSQKEG